EKLFTNYDIRDVFNGIESSFFTLDQPDGKHEYHPFQHMKYTPPTLKGTDTLATLLMTDYVLKCLTTGKEASGIVPFNLRDISEGFMKEFPEKIKKDLILETKNSFSKAAHRFWIDAGDLEYDVLENGDKII